MSACFVTTLDNPFDFFKEFDKWNEFDQTHGYEVIGMPYNTLSYVARIANTSTTMSQKDYEEAVEAAVDEICRLNLTGNYKKVWEKSPNMENNIENTGNEGQETQGGGVA